MIALVAMIVIFVIYQSYIYYLDCVDKLPWTSRFSEKDQLRMKKTEEEWLLRMKKMQELRERHKPLNKDNYFEDF